MLKEVRLEGKQASVWLVSEDYFCTTCKDGGHTHNSACGECETRHYVYSGSAKIVNEKTEKFIVLNFVTLRAGQYRLLSTDDPEYRGYSLSPFDYNRLNFEDNILSIEDDNGDISPLTLTKMIRPEGVIDLFAYKLAVLANKEDRLPIPRIILPVISAKDLIKKGMMAAPDGQIALVAV